MMAQVRQGARAAAGSASPSGWGARAVVVATPFVVLAAGTWDGARVGWLLAALVALGGVASAVQPTSHVATGTLLLLVLFWWWWVPSASDAPVLLAAAALIAFHVATTLSAYGPPTMDLPGDLVRRWLGRGLLVWLVALLAWAAERLTSPSDVAVVLALVVVGGVAWWAAFRFGPTTETGQG
ncbi:MAG: hypothetical protein ACR2FG_07760 [Marmoricola sp.]